ncbi:MAG: hypothetical protein P7H58_00665 [Microcoleus anatoxicus]
MFSEFVLVDKGVGIRSPLTFFIDRRSMKSVDAIAPHFFTDRRSHSLSGCDN